MKKPLLEKHRLREFLDGPLPPENPMMKRYLQDLEDAGKKPGWRHAVGEHIDNVGSRFVSAAIPHAVDRFRDFYEWHSL